MSLSPEVLEDLNAIPNSRVIAQAPLSDYTRFAIGGPAELFFDTGDETAFVCALKIMQRRETPRIIIGGGTNLVVSDAGFRGVALRFTASRVHRNGSLLEAGAGAVLQDVVDRSISLGLEGLQTMTGIPGYLGGAVYGNAGAYGHSIQEIVRQVRIFDGLETVTLRNQDCQFAYRESIFKKHKDWIILSADLEFADADGDTLKKTAAGIRAIRDAKYPPAMKCAGSIFKNLLLSNLAADVADRIPPKVIREGKVPSAWFLQQAGACGLRRGDIQVADYHANLIYNDGQASAADLVAVIQELKTRVLDRFGLALEEEVQFVGFNGLAHY